MNAAKIYLSRDNMNALYYSLVHSLISHGNLVWVSGFQYRLKNNPMKRKCTRNISKIPYNEHTILFIFIF